MMHTEIKIIFRSVCYYMMKQCYIYRVGHKSFDKNALKSLTGVKRLMAHPV
jgi:hypothetical protein